MASVIDNDTLSGLPQTGTQVGDFLGNMAPGLGKFLLITALFGAIVGVIYAVSKRVNKKI
jgi:hypothetical protein